jgi:hypothetical protein
VDIYNREHYTFGSLPMHGIATNWLMVKAWEQEDEKSIAL